MFKVGDKVISIKYGSAIIMQISNNKPYNIIIKCTQDKVLRARTEEGRAYSGDYLPDIYHAKNFISPIAPEPERLPDWPVDTKLIVSNFSDFSNSKYRYFKKFDKSSQAVCFTFGATSWSGTATVKWPYYKLAEEN